jgi:formylglycine-generating enzyme required for sulfatase activity
MLLIPVLALSSAQKLDPFTETLPKSVVKIKMSAIPGGTIDIRGKSVEVKPFWIATTEMPWEAFDAFTASGPSSKPYDQTAFAPDAVARPSKSYILPDLGWGHHGNPAINLSFTSVDMFCRWLAKETKKKYRLPTEAEWEIACRAGSSADPDKSQLAKIGWFKSNSDGMTHPVGQKAPNAFGLYDMYGNVGEWATDLDGKPILCGSTFGDSTASATTRRRWAPSWQETDPQIPKSRWWLADAPFAGFRIVCEP